MRTSSSIPASRPTSSRSDTPCGCTSSRSTRYARSRTSSTPARWNATRGSVFRSRTSAARRRCSHTGIASLADREPELARRSPAGAVEYLRRLYYDTGLADNAPALAATLELTSLEHVVFGTDWPYLALPEGDDPAPGLAWLGDARAGVDGPNASALVPGVVA